MPVAQPTGEMADSGGAFCPWPAGADSAFLRLRLTKGFFSEVQTTQMCLHADMRLKEKALLPTTPLGVKAARFRPDDKLLTFLEGL